MTQGRRGRAFIWVLLAAALVSAYGATRASSVEVERPAASPASSPAPEGPGLPAPTAWQELDGLRIAEPDPDMSPYRRAAFGDGWDYDPASGCNTRELVLIEEAVQEPVVDDRCRSTEGRWLSLYDGVEVDSVAELQIDHLIPLAEAWRSGAADWPQERREAFSNDLTHPDSLIAVSGSTNQSKGDSPPHRWMPPDPAAWCTYAEMWVGVKARWDLSVTEDEHATLAAVLTSC